MSDNLPPGVDPEVAFPPYPPEAEVLINGAVLSPGQSMTLRVALESFLMTLAAEGLGSDEHGRKMTKNYTARGDEIRMAMAVNRWPAQHSEIVERLVDELYQSDNVCVVGDGCRSTDRDKFLLREIVKRALALQPK